MASMSDMPYLLRNIMSFCSCHAWPDQVTKSKCNFCPYLASKVRQAYGENLLLLQNPTLSYNILEQEAVTVHFCHILKYLQKDSFAYFK